MNADQTAPEYLHDIAASTYTADKRFAGDPAFRSVVDTVWRLTREEAALDIENADTSGWPGGRGSDVDGFQQAAARIAREGSRP
jgi:hypothetical protein